MIWPLRCQRIEVIDNGENARAQWNLPLAQSPRVAASVPSFVMVQDERRNGVGKRDVANDGGADPRVNPHLLEFFGGQRSRLREDVLRHGALGDCAQQSTE